MCIQSARKLVPIENRHPIATPGKLGRTSQRRRAGTDTRDLFSVWRPGPEQLDVSVEDVVHGITLQPANLDRLLVSFVHDAGAFAQNLSRTHPPATMAQNIRLKNYPSRTSQIVRGDFLDESGHVDMRGACRDARSIEAVQASSGFDGSLTRRHRRRKLGEILLVLLGRELGRNFAEIHRASLGPQGSDILASQASAQAKRFSSPPKSSTPLPKIPYTSPRTTETENVYTTALSGFTGGFSNAFRYCNSKRDDCDRQRYLRCRCWHFGRTDFRHRPWASRRELAKGNRRASHARYAGRYRRPHPPGYALRRHEKRR